MAFAGGLGWLLGGQVAARSINFASFLAMALFLSPDDLGRFALCWAIVGTADALFDLGMQEYWIRDGARNPRTEATLFTASVALAACWTALGTCVAVVVARGAAVEFLVSGTLALVPLLALRAFAIVPVAVQVLERDLRAIARRETLAAASGALVGTLAAALDAGFAALVLRLIAQSLCSCALALHATDWRPRMGLDRIWLGRALRFGVPLSAAGNLSWLVLNQVELWAIGTVLGTGALGLYQFARRPLELVSQLMNAVRTQYLLRELTPLPASPRAAVRRHERRFLLAGTALSLGLFGLAALIPASLDVRWHGAAPLLLVLAPTALVTPLGSVYAAWLTARARIGELFAIGVLGAAINAALVLALVRFGLVPLALGWAATLAATTAALALAARRDLASLAGSAHARALDPRTP